MFVAVPYTPDLHDQYDNKNCHFSPLPFNVIGAANKKPETFPSYVHVHKNIMYSYLVFSYQTVRYPLRNI